MSVKAEELTNPEQGLDLSDRDPVLTKRRRGPALDGDLESIRQRIDIAREIKAPDLHCSHCVGAFAAGRDATLKLIEW